MEEVACSQLLRQAPTKFRSAVCCRNGTSPASCDQCYPSILASTSNAPKDRVYVDSSGGALVSGGQCSPSGCPVFRRGASAALPLGSAKADRQEPQRPFPMCHFPFPTARQHGTWRTRCSAKTRGLVKVVDARVGVFAIKDGTRPPICILSLAILIPFGPCHLQHRLLQRTGASSRGTLQARTGSRSLPSGDFEIQERTFISSRPTTPIATPRGETMSEIRTMWRLLPC